MSLSINNQTYTNLHFIGIFGIGMSAIAQYLAPQCSITGSDRALNSIDVQDISTGLMACGCSLFEQDGSGITSQTDAIVVSTAIEKSNPDMAQAKKLGIIILHRSEVLAAIVAQSRTISVTGTSGKSSVSAMIFHVLKEAGLSPSYIGGAKLHALKNDGLIGNAFRGKSELLVIEADESDGTVVNYHPEISLLLNISKDHKEISEVQEMLTIAAKQSKIVIKNGEDTYLKAIKGITFGLTASSMIYPTQKSTSALLSRFTIEETSFQINQPGEHTILNGLATYAVAKELGITDKDIQKALVSYQGIERRFDRYEAARGIVVIDDYAHNPEKISAAIKAAQLVSEQVTAVFQPHGFGPLAFMLSELTTMFQTTLRPKDKLYILPVYYVGGTVDRTINSKTLVSKINQPQTMLTTKEALQEQVKNLPNSAALLILGARDPSLPALAKDLAQRIS